MEYRARVPDAGAEQSNGGTDMKKIIAINGSPRRNGNTAELLQHALRGAADAGADEKKTIAITYKGLFGKDAYGYWIPLPEQPEYILHFSVGITTEYEEAKNVTVTKDVLGK